MISKFRMEAFVSEFPFLTTVLELMDGKSLNAICVKRMDERLLLSTPSYDEVCGNSTSSFWGDEYVFLIRPNEVVEHRDFKFYWTDNNHESGHEKGRPIIESMSGLETHLAIVTNDYNNYGHVQAGRTLTIYKVGKGMNIASLIASAKARTLAKVKAEADV